MTLDLNSLVLGRPAIYFHNWTTLDEQFDYNSGSEKVDYSFDVSRVFFCYFTLCNT